MVGGLDAEEYAAYQEQQQQQEHQQSKVQDKLQSPDGEQEDWVIDAGARADRGREEAGQDGCRAQGARCILAALGKHKMCVGAHVLPVWCSHGAWCVKDSLLQGFHL